MALKTTTKHLKAGEQKEYDNIIGVINDSNTAIYYDFAEMVDNRGGVPIVKKGDEDKFPPQKVWVRATTASSNIILMEAD
jgi:hypothetical protein